MLRGRSDFTGVQVLAVEKASLLNFILEKGSGEPFKSKQNCVCQLIPPLKHCFSVRRVLGDNSEARAFASHKLSRASAETSQFLLARHRMMSCAQDPLVTQTSQQIRMIDKTISRPTQEPLYRNRKNLDFGGLANRQGLGPSIALRRPPNQPRKGLDFAGRNSGLPVFVP